MEAFQEALSRSRETAMLDLRFLNGTVESFSYSYLTRVRFEPGDIICMRFGRDQIQITGRNLKRLCETITEQRTRFIQEGAEGDEHLKPNDESGSRKGIAGKGPGPNHWLGAGRIARS